jgi:hypothetical protein
MRLRKILILENQGYGSLNQPKVKFLGSRESYMCWNLNNIYVQDVTLLMCF